VVEGCCLTRGSHYKGWFVGWLAGKFSDCFVIRSFDGLLKVPVEGVARGLADLPLESFLEIYGVVENGVLRIYMYRVLETPLVEREVDYLDAVDWDPVTYATNYVWGARHPVYRYTLLLQSILLRFMREYLVKNGFVELLSPVISPSSDPGLRGAGRFKTSFYGVEYELSSSIIMFKQLSVSIFPRVFFIARNVREEPVENIDSGRHLCEFTQLDVEKALSDMDDVMKLGERLVYYVSKRIADKYCELIVDKIGLRKEPVIYKPPYPRISYDEAIDLLQRHGVVVKWGRELGFDAEKVLSNYFQTPFWITNYPVSARGFYYKTDPDDPRVNMDFNLILPEGYGELIDGGVREHRFMEIVEKIKRMGEALEKYDWFLKHVKMGAIIPSGGWGLGVERFTAYLAGHRHVAYAAFYPKLPGIHT